MMIFCSIVCLIENMLFYNERRCVSAPERTDIPVTQTWCRHAVRQLRNCCCSCVARHTVKPVKRLQVVRTVTAIEQQRQRDRGGDTVQQACPCPCEKPRTAREWERWAFILATASHGMKSTNPSTQSTDNRDNRHQICIMLLMSTVHEHGIGIFGYSVYVCNVLR